MAQRAADAVPSKMEEQFTTGFQKPEKAAIEGRGLLSGTRAMLFRRLGARERGRVPHMVEPQLQPPNEGRASGRLRQSRMLPSSEPPMPRTFYIWTRDLHLYLGLLVSPFLILFAVSVF